MTVALLGAIWNCEETAAKPPSVSKGAAVRSQFLSESMLYKIKITFMSNFSNLLLF